LKVSLGIFIDSDIRTLNSFSTNSVNFLILILIKDGTSKNNPPFSIELIKSTLRLLKFKISSEYLFSPNSLAKLLSLCKLGIKLESGSSNISCSIFLIPFAIIDSLI